ncbi:hypothetical protein G6011_09586 [Alternaria panax]|uniref:Heterokaryon incompatibility domain-containing protein n=1 Tax=Alternaria panax TaxID=48097 RepID=A0AAD4I5G8_9PLEO|nr:hypothetical protein G6011_09586 [Alternaria panax]
MSDSQVVNILEAEQLPYRAAPRATFTDTTNPEPFDIQDAEVFTTHNTHLNGHIVARCELRSNAHEHAPPYVGLSYAWGDPELQCLILFDGKIFHSTENLAITLEHLQEDDKTITFWIDALCIDQTNLLEKTKLVQRMGGIFTSAALVIAWLGPAAHGSDLATEEMESYPKDASASILRLRESFKENSTAPPLETITAVFKRVWVGQVALNKQVIRLCSARY